MEKYKQVPDFAKGVDLPLADPYFKKVLLPTLPPGKYREEYLGAKTFEEAVKIAAEVAANHPEYGHWYTGLQQAYKVVQVYAGR